jgi:hypothetical protein
MPASDRVRTEVNPESPVGNHISNYSTNVLFNESSQNRDSAPICPNVDQKGFTLPIDQFYPFSSRNLKTNHVGRK